ncbi:ATP-binding cassette domain-containing protein [Microbacterium terricola]|uniref:ABC transporter domain-containing protein n=1 Tax=Microbacterium terricola TaxID=344163 RepID=A0ABM8E2W3_9MICO|nr:ATP-binding cassette domain-containing protein [Microbacterium terricola]UYK40178.1 ATP-binding cassette domain-containing protein [Microbacterium terricola]BDV32116.1 hypothetical protein Microterr_27760 [Microbacterium terricola]
MSDGVLEFTGVTKRFGAVAAVSDFSARVEPGVVTGFLGPNGAGKTTTMRILLGLVRATGGTATIGGVPYAKLQHPLQSVGAVLESSSFHPGRSGANHLKVYAHAAGLPVSRVDEVLGLVGLADAAGRKVGGYSLGMRQRLGLAFALLGDPGVLVLDEPTNGLDPEGITWIRGFLRLLAAEGRTVFVSSHLLAEVQQTVDAALIISRGRLVYQGALEDLADPTEYTTVVDAPDRDALMQALTAHGASFDVLRTGLSVRGSGAAEIGAVAAQAGIALSALQRRGPALEEVFFELVSGVRVHPSATSGGDAAAPAVEPEPAVDEAEVAEPEPGVAEPETHEPEPEPETEAEVPEPEAAEPEAAEPEAAEPEVAEPEVEILEPEAEAPEPEPEPEIAVEPEPEPEADVAPEPEPGGEESEDVDEAEEVEEAEPLDRPWESHEKTESDVEADRFFSSFDEDAARAARVAADEAADREEGEQR